MALFGLTDIWVIGAYVGCVICVIIAWAFALFKKDKVVEEEGEE